MEGSSRLRCRKPPPLCDLVVEEVMECGEGEVEWRREPKRPVRRDSVDATGDVS